MKVMGLIMTLSLLVACQKSSTTTETTSTSSTAAVSEKTYTMTGQLVSRDALKKEVTIDNEEIPGGVMPRMTMAYQYRGGDVGTLPANGTTITSTLHEQNGTSWVTDVKAKP